MDERRQPGDVIEWLNRRYRIVGELSREEFDGDLHKRREQDRRAGKPPARAGVYNPETREFRPTREVPSNCRFCYRVEELGAFEIG